MCVCVSVNQDIIRRVLSAGKSTYTLERRISVVLGLLDTVTVSLAVCYSHKLLVSELIQRL